MVQLTVSFRHGPLPGHTRQADLIGALRREAYLDWRPITPR